VIAAVSLRAMDNNQLALVAANFSRPKEENPMLGWRRSLPLLRQALPRWH